MSDASPSAPVAATVPPTLDPAATPPAAPAVIPTAAAPPPPPPPPVEALLPTGEFRVLAPLDYTDAEGKSVHLEVGDVAEVPAGAVLALASAHLIEVEAVVAPVPAAVTVDPTPSTPSAPPTPPVVTP